MKFKNILIGTFLSFFTISCIQDEALNVEAAIDGCNGSNIQLININDLSREIDVFVFEGADITAQELNFTLPDGATICPEKPQSNDNPPFYDFSSEKNRKFTVTSEDGNNKATYTINLYTIELPLKYSFENLKEINPYHILYLTDISGLMQWASGNQGYSLCGMASNAMQYPTVQADGGFSGKCVKLVTQSTGSFGMNTIPKMPIAAGNLFIGSFDIASAILAPRQATKFGFPFTRKPIKMSGYYKYKPGTTLTDQNGNVIPDKTDTGDIYAVLYEAPNSDFSLDGDLFTADNEKAKNIVLLARIDKMEAADQWTRFDLDFKLQNNKTINEEKLKAGKYKLTIVFSSSIQGGYFEGAIGSELCIDEVEITCE